MFEEIDKIEAVLVRVNHDDAQDALRALDAIQRALEEVSEAGRHHQAHAWHGETVEVWSHRFADLVRKLRA